MWHVSHYPAAQLTVSLRQTNLIKSFGATAAQLNSQLTTRKLESSRLDI